MASDIDTTQPPEGAATTAAVRDNFAAAKAEIEALQGELMSIQAALDQIMAATAPEWAAAALQNKPWQPLVGLSGLLASSCVKTTSVTTATWTNVEEVTGPGYIDCCCAYMLVNASNIPTVEIIADDVTVWSGTPPAASAAKSAEPIGYFAQTYVSSSRYAQPVPGTPLRFKNSLIVRAKTTGTTALQIFTSVTRLAALSI